MLPSIAQLLPKLTAVTAGQDPRTVLTAGRINAIQDILRQLVRLSITELREGADGSFTFGNGDDPYILGSTNYGSTGYEPSPGQSRLYGGYGDKGPGWTGSTAIWGGTAATDTWHRDYPPLIPGSASASTDRRSFGVIYVPDRIYISVSGSGYYRRQTFRRSLTLDSLGLPMSISAETEVENDYTSGSGSAGGGI